MEIIYSKQATKAINSMDKITKTRIKTAIEGLTLTPPKGDIKAMQGYTSQTMRLRVGKYRVIFYYDDMGVQRILHIAEIGSRGGIYK